jgi:acyl-CoA thioesterase FadM
MNLYLRLLGVIVYGLFNRKKGGLLDETALTFRVWPNDLDPFWHMNNGRYLTIMDLGRLDYLIKAGLVSIMHKLGWGYALGSSEVQYIKPLLPFQKYELKTKVVCWDDKWFYKEQRFVSNGKTMAVGLVKVLLRGKKGNVPTKEVLEAIGAKLESPEPPVQAKLWREMEKKRQKD